MKLGLLPLASLASAALIAIACRNPAKNPTDDIRIPSHAGYDEPPDLPDGGYRTPACAAACISLLRAGCGEAVRRPNEDSCYIVCQRAEDTGGLVDFKPACVARASDVASIRACKTYRCTAP